MSAPARLRGGARRVALGLLTALGLSLAGCRYTVVLRADAAGARVEGLPEGSVLLPAEVRVPWTPWRRRMVTISAPGRRPLRLDLGIGTIAASDAGPVRRLLGGGRHAEVDLRLIPIHDAAGSWAPEELPR